MLCSPLVHCSVSRPEIVPSFFMRFRPLRSVEYKAKKCGYGVNHPIEFLRASLHRTGFVAGECAWCGGAGVRSVMEKTQDTFLHFHCSPMSRLNAACPFQRDPCRLALISLEMIQLGFFCFKKSD